MSDPDVTVTFTRAQVEQVAAAIGYAIAWPAELVLSNQDLATLKRAEIMLYKGMRESRAGRIK